MYNVFKEFGDINEVVITPRRDKRGKRFKFARFNNVENERMLAVKLDNIVIGTKKIHANVPKFNREMMKGTINRRNEGCSISKGMEQYQKN